MQNISIDPTRPGPSTSGNTHTHALHALKALLYGLHKSFSPHFSSQSITTMQFLLNCALAPWAAAPYALAETRITRAVRADATWQIDYLLERCIGFNISLLSAYMSCTFFFPPLIIECGGATDRCESAAFSAVMWEHEWAMRKWKWFLECNWFGSALFTDAHFVARKSGFQNILQPWSTQLHSKQYVTKAKRLYIPIKPLLTKIIIPLSFLFRLQ